MHIIFLGQLGLPLLATREEATREKRAADLAKELATLGHTVTVCGTSPYVSGTGMNYHGVRVRHVASLNPTKPGGWLYTVLAIMAAIRQQPSVVHIQGWKTAAVARLLRIANSTVTLVWTIDSIVKARPWLATWPPSGFTWIARWIVAGVDEVTTPTRALQYQLLNQHGIRAAYIPDGYTASTLPLVPASHFGIRSSAYTVLLADSPARVRQVATAYKQTGTRRKLIVLQSPTGAFKRLANQFTFLQFVGQHTGRSRRSIIAQATMVIADRLVSPQVLLETMAAGIPIIATTHALYQELCGTTALFYTTKDAKGLIEAIALLLQGAAKSDKLGRAASKRARLHFLKPRTVSEYLVAYQSYRQVVALDSARRPLVTQLSTPRSLGEVEPAT